MKRWILAVMIAGAGCGGPPEQPADWQEEGGFRWRELRVSPGRAGFTEVGGVDFVNVLSDQAIVQNRNRKNGSGVGIGDVDADGLPDLLFAGMESRPRLYRNLGNWEFRDVTDEAGLGEAPFWSTGVAFADVDGDTDLDLFLTVLTGPNVLYLNDGSGSFTPAEAGLSSNRGSMTAAFSDTDGDGDLDLYVTNYKRIAARDSLPPDRLLMQNLIGPGGRVIPELSDHFRLGEVDGRPIRIELGEEDQYYLNDGTGRFSPAPIPDLDRDWGLAVALRDMTGDGLPDLYVANDFESPDYFLMGNGKGGWQATIPRLPHTSNSSMSVAVSDVNRDGLPDIFVPDMLSPDPAARRFQAGTAAPIRIEEGDLASVPQYMQNSLFLRIPPPAGRPDFAEVAQAYDAAATDWTWAAQFLDVDLDGWPDLLMTTGHSFDVQDVDAQLREREAIRRVRSVEEFRSLILEYPRLELPNVAMRNVEGGRFERMRDGWGLGADADISHGLALGDLDGDGDLDVVLNRLNAPAGVFRNDTGAGRVAVRVRLAEGNTHGVGWQVNGHEITAGGGYLSGSEAMVTLPAPSDSTLVIRFRDRVRVIRGVTPNRLYEITEPPNEPLSVATGPASTRPRSGASAAQARPPDTTHVPAPLELPFDDRSLQPLLPRNLAVTGPQLATGDLTGDGIGDLIQGAGRGGVPLLHSGTDGALVAGPAAAGDWTGVAVSDGRLLAAESGYETGDAGRLLTFGPGFRVLGQRELPFSATGPVAAAGDLVFVGARMDRARYPLPVPSLLIAGEALFPLEAGLVTGADFADFDGDGDQDLAVSSEWGPVRVFRNDDGRFTDSGLLDGYAGLWQSVAWGDVDADGRPDLVAGNWGWNSRLGRPDDSGRPVRIYHGDFDGNGTYDLIEAEYRRDLDGWSPIVDFNTLRNAVPILARRVSSWHAYAESTVEDLFGPDLSFMEANTLASMVFLNRGDRFEAHRLPPEAQWTPANALVVEGGSIRIAQNFFPLFPTSTTRQDAGRGLLLENGRAIPLGVFGDQRSVVRWNGRTVFSRHGGTTVVLEK